MPRVLLLSKEGCNPCKRVKRLLDEVAQERPGLETQVVDFSSPEGAALALRHSILYPPAVFVDGRLLGYGKILEGRLREALEAPPAEAGRP